MASKDIINSVDVNNPSSTRRSADLLPTYHRTERNTKFLASTLDQLIQQPQIERVDGFVGSKLTPNYDPNADQYIQGLTKLKNDYQLEPALVISDVAKNIKLALGYDDLIGELSFNGADVSNHDRLFRPLSYSYNPHIDWDKFVNFRQYYWLPTGPDAIEITGQQKNTISTYSVKDSEDKFSLIFTPDGASTNPLLTLYRGMTYVFNVDSEFPFFVKTAYVSGSTSLYSNTTNNGVKQGQVIVTIDEYTPNFLFYYAEGNPGAVGQFAIKSITENSSLDIDADIIGKKTYKSGNGVNFTNGMKVRFVGNVLPDSYLDKEFIVEGVGSYIKLIDYATLQAISTETTDLDVNFDAQPFDQYPFDNFRYIPLTPEYVTINRASLDQNPWSKYNRWVHEDVITATAKANGVVAVYPVDKRAQRPIIEFEAGLQLFNYGSIGKANIDLIDNVTTDAFRTVENSAGLYVDGVLLDVGYRVIFNADKDPLVRGKVYEVKSVNLNGKQRIDLEEVIDSEPLLNEAVIVTRGLSTAGTAWWFNGSEWVFAQQKTKLNQAPLFDLYDETGFRFSDQSVYKSSFGGTKVFGYTEGTVYDSVLGFNLAYRNVANVGEYLFSNFFMTDTFTNYLGNTVQLLNVSNGFLKINSFTSSTFSTVWSKTIDRPIPIIQYQVLTEDSVFVEINAINQPGFATDLDVEVFVNDVKKVRNVDYTKTVSGEKSFIVSSSTFSATDRILIKLYTSRVPNENGYYEPPINLTNNPLNGPISDFSFTEISDHVRTMVDSNPDFTGVFPGSSNLRDLSNLSPYGSRIVSHSNPISFAHYFLGTTDHNIINAIRHVSADYNQFKTNLLRHITELKGTYTPSQSLDLALINLNSTKDNTSSYNYSDMVPYGKNNTTRIFTVTSPRNVRYSLASVFDTSVLSERAVLVYLNGDLLVKDYDYYIPKHEPSVVITKTLAKNDTITVIDYPSTAGSFVPPTPTKLGLYPKFKPSIFIDDTYITPTKVIQGHDGSITVAFNDYRDDIILEFEKRVYNNIKTTYNPDLLDIDSIIPGAFRSSEYNKQEVTKLLTPDFLRWAGYFGIDFASNSTFDELNSFSFNYTGTIDTINKTSLNGYWRGIYKFFFDTDRPHSHPWEMLGFREQPTWWETVYGPAPYTNGNLILWKDLEEGKIAEPGNERINALFSRPGLQNIIPVDSEGRLVSPTDSGLALTPIYDAADPRRIVVLRNEQIAKDWVIGDYSPAETAWRRSSWYPFAVQVLLALTKPASYSALMFDPSRMKKNLAGEWRYGNDELFLNPSSVSIPNDINDDNRVFSSGHSVFLVEYGTLKNSNFVADLKEDFSNISYNLVSKLNGFASKDKLQVGIDAIDPSSPYPGVLLPSEDYQIFFNKSSPIDSIGISGIIIQKTGTGWSIRGYDKYNPYFTVFKPFASNADQTERVGGTSEKFVNWKQETTYNAGQIVFYNDRYYRVTQKHNSGQTFSLAYYQSLPYLPIVGGVGVLRRTNFDNNEIIIPYGVEYRNIQEVYDFIVGYGKWLESKGFVFDEYNQDLDQILDWRFTAKEFLYWTTQNWAVNSVITLSPFANKLVFRSAIGIVDSIVTPFQEYSLLKADGSPFSKNKFTIVRLDGEFVLTTVNTQEGVYFARLNLVQKEHALVMNNFTIFNDVIYDVETGYRQRRIKLKGFITKDWNGDFFSPGFVFDQANVSDWEKFTDYSVGDVVRFSGKYYSAIKTISGTASFDITQWALLTEKPEAQLLPNFDYKINQFEDFYSLDIDNFDIGQQSMAQHLIGYTPRPYLNYIIGDPIAQYKFYQGFIREKGTKNALNKLSKASLANFNSTLDFNEEWAFRVGFYGGYNTYSELEFNLETTGFVENPQVIKFVENLPTDDNSTVYYKDLNSLIVKPNDFDISKVFDTVGASSDLFKLPVAGYVRHDDVTATAYNKNSILDIANNAALKNGDTIWLGFREDGEWDVLRVSEIPTYISGVSINVPGQSIVLSTYYAHQLSVNDLISVTGVGTGIDQCYIVQEVLNLNQVVVLSTLTSLPELPSRITGLIFAFKSSRLENFDKLSSVPFLDRWKEDENVWVDSDSNGNWAVYKKSNNYKIDVPYSSEVTSISGQHFGSAIASSDNDSLVIISGPDYSPGDATDYRGRVFVSFRNSYGDLQLLDDFSLIDGSGNRYYTTSSNSLETAYGFSLAFDSTNKLVVAGAPKTSNVKPTFATATHIINYSTTTVGTQLNQGVVKLSLLNTQTSALLTNKSVAITVSSPTAGANFGHSLALSTPDATTSTILVNNTASISVGYAVTGTFVVGQPLVTSIGNNLITVNVPQALNTSSSIYFSNSVKAYTDVDNTTTLIVSTTTGILINGKIFSPFISGFATVTGIGDYSITVQNPLTITTESSITIVNTSTEAFTLGTRQKLAVGAPSIDSTGTGAVYIYNLDVTPGTTGSISVTVGSQPTLVYSTSSVNELYGWDVTGNKTLTRMAVSAAGFTGTSATSSVGAVYVYDHLTTSSIIQTITGNDLGVYSLSQYSFFANKVEMSNDGQTLIVASPFAYDPAIGLRSGVVDVFRWTGDQFSHSQRISAPISAITTGTIFGWDISLSSSNETLVITSVGEAKTVTPSFDVYSQRYSATAITSLGLESVYINDPSSSARAAKTTFDGNSTSFISKLRDAGTAHVYNKLGEGSTKWAYAQPLITSSISTGSMYGSAVLALNDSVIVGAPAKTLAGDNGHNSGIGQVFIYDKIDTSVCSWKLHRYEEPLVDISSVKRAITIDSDKSQIRDYFDIIDPIKGKILGNVEEELKYITVYDPAVYSLGILGVNVDSNSNWLDEHVGELWWDLSTVKYVWYEQGELDYRKNNWNNVFPGSSIDVYEWVRSEYLPTEWAQIADTPEGLTRGISGQPKFNDNSVISVKQVYNSVSNGFTNVYYYWVKNKVVAPAGVKNRSKAAFEISQQIADPINAGTQFVGIIGPNSLILANTKPTVVSEKINLNISFDSILDAANRHTEWMLLQENDPNSKPNWLLEKKLTDSLLGHDSLGNPVPDPSLPAKLRYGTEIRPRQSLFVDRKGALRNAIEFVNFVMINELLTGQIDFSNLNSVEELPASLLYDTVVEDIYNLELIATKNLLTAEVSAVVDSNGSILRVDIISSGFGYISSPLITINGQGSDAVLQANLNQFGQLVSVDVIEPGKNYSQSDIELIVRPYTVAVKVDETSANKWSIYEWNDSKLVWVKTRTQSYNTSVYWKYVDWKDSSYDPLRVLTTTVGEPYALEVLQYLPEGSYVKVKNGGDGRYLILSKTNGTGGSFEPDWNIVYSENGTIQFLDMLWDTGSTLFAWDQKVGFDQTQFDQEPDKEISYILNAIKDDIFIDDRKIYWNQLFFKLVRYAMTEQKFLDWAFKTTFISVVNNAGPLDQSPVYKLNNAQYYEDYLKEIKPYHTKIRRYTEVYTGTELTNTFNTDFDMPVYYNTSTLNFNKVEFGNNMLLQYPWKAWFDNYTYEVSSIEVYDGGSGYTQIPDVDIVAAPGDTGVGATAVAYISLGKVTRIIVTNPGKGYTATPTVVLRGGGSTSLTPARVYAQLGNCPVRANTVHIKFDRTTAEREVGSQFTSTSFVSDGSDVTYPLPWPPKPNKEDITLKRNGILQLIDSYDIVYEKTKYVTQENNQGNVVADYSKLFATLKLLFVPDEGDLIEIEYPKHLDLYNAASRIEDYYTPSSGMPGKELAQLMSGIEYSGLQVIGLPFDAAGGWDAQGISWAATSWDNLGTEPGYSSFLTTSSNTQSFVISSLIATGTQVNCYFKASDDLSVAGVRIDDPEFKKFVGTWSSLLAYNTSTIVEYNGAYYQATQFVNTSIVVPLSSPEWERVSYNGNARISSFVGLGTGAVDRIDMIVTGSGYVSAYTSVSISAPNTLNGKQAVGQLVINSGSSSISSIEITEPGSGYTEPPIVTIIEAINPSHLTATVSIQAYARAVLKAEFVEAGTTATTSTVTIPSDAFTTPSGTLVFRYSSSDGTVTPTDLDSLDALIDGGDLTMTTALGVNPSEIILDGGSKSTQHITGMNDDGFLNPINSYAPEECVPGQVRESLGISVYSQPINISPLITNKRYWVDGTTLTYKLGVRPANNESLIAVFNNERLMPSNYTIDYDANTFTFNSINPGTGWLSLTSMQLGTVSLLDSFEATTSTNKTVWTSIISYDEVGSSYVTVNGIEIPLSTSAGVANTYTLTKYRGNARITVNASGVIQAYLFRESTDSFSRINEVDYVSSGTNTIPLDPIPGKAGPFHSQVIVSIVSGTSVTRLSPPVTTYYQVDAGQNVFDISKSTVYSLGRIDLARLEVYVNGTRVQPLNNWKFNQLDNEVEFLNGTLKSGDLVAIVIKEGHEYLIENGNLVLTQTPSAGLIYRVVTFTNHDPDFIRSERYVGNPGNQYVMQRSVLDRSYVWVSYNGKYLTLNVDYTVGIDNRTISIRNGIYQDSSDLVIITSFADRVGLTGFRIFRDLLGRTHYKRISNKSSTALARELKLGDTTIEVEDASVLTQPKPQFNVPGVILIEGERVEYFVVQGNTLSQIRRATLGTGARDVYSAGTFVIDQGSTQTIPYQEQIQKFVATSTSTDHYEYDLTGQIGFINDAPFTDQVEVRYQGTLLLKPTTSANHGIETYIHNNELAFDSTTTLTTSSVIDVYVPHGFTINTLTNVLTLNSSTIGVVTGGRLEVIKKSGQTWYNSADPLDHNSTVQALFINRTESIIPNYRGE